MENPEHYAKTKNFVLGDGVAGFAINEGDLIAVHKNPAKALQMGIEGVMPYLMICAIENGATKLDCYGDILAKNYMDYGFIPVATMDFNIEYNPDWPVKEYKKPNVIVMLNACQNLNELNVLQDKNKLISFYEIIASLPKFDDYIEMLSYRDRLLSVIKEGNMNYEQSVQLVLNNDYQEDLSCK